MGWVLRLVETGVEGSSRSVDVLVIDPSGDLDDIAALGLTRASGLWLWANRKLSQSRAETVPPDGRCVAPVNRVPGQGLPPPPDRHRVRSGCAPTAPLPLPRLRRRGGGWPAHCRSTPELDQVRAQFSACMPYRVAAGVLEHLLPIDAGSETLRAHTLKVGADLVDTAATNPATAASSITLTLDSTFIRSCEDGQRHLELGNVETSDGGRQVFAAVTKPDTSIEALIQRGL